jgi:hypothetical protein
LLFFNLNCTDFSVRSIDCTQYKSFRLEQAAYSPETLRIEKAYRGILQVYAASIPYGRG